MHSYSYFFIRVENIKPVLTKFYSLKYKDRKQQSLKKHFYLRISRKHVLLQITIGIIVYIKRFTLRANKVVLRSMTYIKIRATISLFWVKTIKCNSQRLYDNSFSCYVQREYDKNVKRYFAHLLYLLLSIKVSSKPE